MAAASARAALVVAPLAAAAVYLPNGAAGLAVLALAALALTQLPGSDRAERAALGRWPLALFAWLALSALWSPAPAGDVTRHLAHYSFLLGVVVVAAATPPRAARAAVGAFVAATALFGLLQLARPAAVLPPDSLLRSMAHYVGNKSIANAVLMALGAAIALDMALMGGIGTRARVALAVVAAGVACTLLVTSGARTSLVVLAVLVLIVAGRRMRRAWHWALLAAAAIAAVALVAGGRSGLAERADAQLLAASSAQRLQLYGVTLEMIAERPIVGHGVGSWRPLWQQRNRDPAMAGFNTAHQEPLQFAQQGGLVAVALLLATWAAWLRAAWPGPGEASAALLAWAAFVLTAMFNAAIRDLSFGLPLLTMLGLTLAASRRS